MRRGGRGGRRWRHRWRHSLRVRLVIVFVLLALAMTAVFLGGMQRAFSTGWRDAARPLVADYMDRSWPRSARRPTWRARRRWSQRLPISIRIEGPVVNWDSHPDRHAARLRPARATGSVAPPPTAIASASASARLPWQREPQGIGWITLALLLVLIVLAYAYVRRLLRPLDDIRAGAERFGRGDFDEPIPLRRRDELGDLAQRINTMARDIQGMLDAKRALLLALSHELRSPLTRARLNAELLPATPEGAAERAALLRDLAEMRDLISDLLESERLASPHAALQREPVDLAALVREVVDEHPAGRARARWISPADLPPLALDRARMRLLLRNLLDNALRHGARGAAQPPRVALRRSGQGVRTRGARLRPGRRCGATGAPDRALLPHRQRAPARTGGVGLGMYLCRLVAEAHGGTLAVRNAQPGARGQRRCCLAPESLETLAAPAWLVAFATGARAAGATMRPPQTALKETRA